MKSGSNVYDKYEEDRALFKKAIEEAIGNRFNRMISEYKKQQDAHKDNSAKSKK